MKAVRVTVAPPNSVVLVSDASGGDIPTEMKGAVVSATSTCIAVGCLSEDDGQTEFTLTPLSEVDQTEKPVYEGMIETPKRQIVVRSVLGQQLLELPVLQELTKIRIWVNDQAEPSKVIVGVD